MKRVLSVVWAGIVIGGVIAWSQGCFGRRAPEEPAPPLMPATKSGIVRPAPTALLPATKAGPIPTGEPVPQEAEVIQAPPDDTAPPKEAPEAKR